LRNPEIKNTILMTRLIDSSLKKKPKRNIFLFTDENVIYKDNNTIQKRMKEKTQYSKSNYQLKKGISYL
jgi:hypothetical protein